MVFCHANIFKGILLQSSEILTTNFCCNRTRLTGQSKENKFWLQANSTESDKKNKT